ncbi:MAG: hypothetical protein HKO64_12785 [Xanthomonadales bacterium]|nr:hypothetical protein [Gammaproteobacteria bacterium]NNL96490.1 hypothetical protein [Xanthomonadales bacterium]
MFLTWLLGIAGVTGLLALFTIELSWQDRLPPLLIGMLITLLAQLWPRRITEFELILLQDGRIRWRPAGGEWQQGSLIHDAWVSKRYAVIAGRGQGWTRRFLLSKSRQDDKTYKMLLSRIRLEGRHLQSPT